MRAGPGDSGVLETLEPHAFCLVHEKGSLILKGQRIQKSICACNRVRTGLLGLSIKPLRPRAFGTWSEGGLGSPLFLLRGWLCLVLASVWSSLVVRIAGPLLLLFWRLGESRGLIPSIQAFVV